VIALQHLRVTAARPVYAVSGGATMARPEYRHRETTYQLLCAQILREARDLSQLSATATRALSHPDVCRDPVLAAMVRSFIAEQEAALRKAAGGRTESSDNQSQLYRPFEVAGGFELPTRAQLVRAFVTLQHEFESHLSQYNEAAARYALEKMEDLAARFPVHIDQAVVRRYRQQFDEFLRRCELYRQQLEQVARHAAEAALNGDSKTANWLLRRLRAIHALTPALLSAERFEVLRQTIEQSGRKHEHRQALRELVARERDVADRIKRIGAAIYRFHRACAKLSPESDEYRRAEAAYREAVGELRSLDDDWLSGLLLELETYLEDLDDPQGRAEAQLDRFIGTVRTALWQLRKEVESIRQQRQPHPPAG
jgi:hypothetical protein